MVWADVLPFRQQLYGKLYRRGMGWGGGGWGGGGWGGVSLSNYARQSNEKQEVLPLKRNRILQLHTHTTNVFLAKYSGRANANPALPK